MIQHSTECRPYVGIMVLILLQNICMNRYSDVVEF